MRKGRHKGFTLIEIVVVLFIIGLVTTIILLKFPNTNRETLRATANQTKGLLVIAREKAILRPAIIGMDVQNQQIRFYELVTDTTFAQQSKWQPFMSDQKNWQVTVKPPLYFSINVAQDARVNVSDQSNGITPAVIFWPNGEMTPFVLTINDARKTAYQITGTYTGEVQLTQPGQSS
jgi:general secretion pathway protein H